jgi:putative membrane protein
MTTTTWTYRLTPLAAALVIAMSLAACNKRENAENTTAATEPTATTPATPAAAPATPPPATPADNTATASTTGDMNAPATPPTTSADASAMSAEPAAAGPITDTTFYQDVLNDGQKEVAASKMAEKSATSKDVKDFAKMLAADHTALDQKVKAAGGKDVTAPTTPADTSALEGKTGKDFDKAYVDAMVADHQKAIAMFENASKNASTDKAKKIASDTLPALRKHLDAAQKLQSSLQ